jgi:hypothetical protein
MRRVVIPTLLACALSACGSNGAADLGIAPGGNSRPNLSGSYTLKTVDAKPVPATVADSTILSGLLTMRDSTWTQVVVVRYTASGAGTPGDSLIEEGRWNVGTGSSITLTDAGSTELYTGTYSGTGFTLSSKTSTLVYAK